MSGNLKKAMFIGIEGIIYGTFILIDLFGINFNQTSIYLKYSSILLCFFYICFAVKGKEKEWDVYVLRFALGFTWVSDTFLLLTDYNEWGVTSFIVVQLCYWYRLHKYKLVDIGRTCLIWAAVIVGLSIFRVPVDLLLFLSSFYFICLVRNVIYALVHRENLLFTIGLVLFLLCDLNVGLFNLTQYIALPMDLGHYVYNCSRVMIWVFYLPSQVCLSLSSRK